METTSSKNPHENVQTPKAPTTAPILDKDSTLPHNALQDKPNPNTILDSDPSSTTSPKEPERHNSKANTDAPLWRAWFARHEEPSKPEPEVPEAVEATDESITDPIGTPIQRPVSNPELATTTPDQAVVPRQWFGLWSAVRAVKAEPIDVAAPATITNVHRPRTSNSANTPKIGADGQNLGSQPTSAAKSPGWAFWSRDTTNNSEVNPSDRSVGDLALAGSPSQYHPESAILDEAPGIVGKRPRSLESAQKVGTSQSQRQKVQKEVSVEPKAKNTSDKHIESVSRENDGTKNLLLPRITATYRPVERPSFMQTLSRLWQYSRPSDTGPVELLDSPPRIKRALTIVRITVQGFYYFNACSRT